MISQHGALPGPLATNIDQFHLAYRFYIVMTCVGGSFSEAVTGAQPGVSPKLRLSRRTTHDARQPSCRNTTNPALLSLLSIVRSGINSRANERPARLMCSGGISGCGSAGASWWAGEGVQRVFRASDGRARAVDGGAKRRRWHGACWRPRGLMRQTD